MLTTERERERDGWICFRLVLRYQRNRLHLERNNSVDGGKCVSWTMEDGRERNLQKFDDEKNDADG